MSFTRQPVNNTSTFSVDGQVADNIAVPTFRRWENTTKETKWELGQGWTLNVPTDESELVFNLNGNDVFRITSTGVASNPILTLENYNDIEAIPSSYVGNGLLARIDGELYMSSF